MKVISIGCLRANANLVNNTITRNNTTATILDFATAKAKRDKENYMFLEIDISDMALVDATADCYAGYLRIEAAGNNLADLLEDSTVFLSDQDGKEVGFIAIQYTPHAELFQKLVREQFKKALGVI